MPTAPIGRSASTVLAILGALLANGCRDDGTAEQSADTDSASTGDDSGDDGSSGTSDVSGEAASVAYLRVLNAMGEPIYLVDTCLGDQCPEPVDTIEGYEGTTSNPEAPVPCAPGVPGTEDLPDALACVVSPLSTFQAGMTVELDRASFELTRPRTTEPNFDSRDVDVEAYWWLGDVVALHGPTTRYGGTYERGDAADPDRLEMVSMSCVDALEGEGIDWAEDQLSQLCTEARMTEVDGQLTSAVGSVARDAGYPCDDEDCCSSCGFQTTVGLDQYGVTGAGEVRSASAGTAIECNQAVDPIVACRDFIVRAEGAAAAEMHYDDRAPLPTGADCSSSSECGLAEACIGTDAEGQTCTVGSSEECESGVCRVEWVGDCDNQGYCVDRRFAGSLRRECAQTNTDSPLGGPGTRMSECGGSQDCCAPELGGDGSLECDVYDLPGVDPLERYDRDATQFPSVVCVCGEEQEGCAETLERECAPPWGSADPAYGGVEGQYAIASVRQLGSPRLNASNEVIDLSFDRAGGLLDDTLANCVPQRLNWFATGTHPEPFDRALCSESEYELRFAGAAQEHHMRGVGGETFDGASTYRFETSPFVVVPDSVFPTPNLNVGLEDSISFRLSAVPLWTRDNLNRILVRDSSGAVVAGGPGCDPTGESGPACLEFDASGLRTGQVEFALTAEDGTTAFAPGTYDVELADEQSPAPFVDVCGKPLRAVTPTTLSFEIDRG